MPTAAHFIYIPSVLIIGIVIGFILGGRSAKDAEAARIAKEASRAARRAAQKARATPEE